MKILFLVYFDLSDNSSIGIQKKVRWQFSALEKLGFQIELAYKKGDKLIFIDSSEQILNEYSITGIWYRSAILKALKKHLMNNMYDVLYVRSPGFVDPAFYNTLKLFNTKKNKVFLELPTYPIGREYITYFRQLYKERKFSKLFIQFIGGTLHRLLSRRIKKFVTYIVTFMDFEKIWGIDVIEIDNGVSIEDIPIRQFENNNNNNSILLLGVANVDIWHGFDRVIHGLADYYYKNINSQFSKKIVFYIVGNGKELESLKKLSSNLQLNDYVFFCGALDGEKLDALFNKADLAVSSLALHRIGISQGSTLKTKEYCARGIPFVYAYKEKKIEETFKYALKILPNEDPIDFDMLIDFLNSIKELNSERNLRDFAEHNFTWETQMKIVSSKFREGD